MSGTRCMHACGIFRPGDGCDRDLRGASFVRAGRFVSDGFLHADSAAVAPFRATADRPCAFKQKTIENGLFQVFSE